MIFLSNQQIEIHVVVMILLISSSMVPSLYIKSVSKSHTITVTMVSDRNQYDQSNTLNQLLYESKDYNSAFNHILSRHDSSLTKKQAIEILNHLNCVSGKSTVSYEKFYQKLLKCNILSAYGSYKADAPVTTLSLPQLEAIYEKNHSSISYLFEVTDAALNSIRIPSISKDYRKKVKTMAYLTNRKHELKNLLQNYIATVVTMTSIVNHSIPYDCWYASILPFYSAILLMNTVSIIDVSLLDSIISNTIKSCVSSLDLLINRGKKRQRLRDNAAMFVVAYLMGMPIRSFDDHRIHSTDGPLVELLDSFDVNSKMNLEQLLSMSIIQSSLIAMECIDRGVSTTGLSDYYYTMFSDLRKCATNPEYSSILNKDLPRHLLPFMALNGFIVATSILKEVGSKIIDEIEDSINNGGSLGDCILILENNIKLDAYDCKVKRRKEIRASVEQKKNTEEHLIGIAIAIIAQAKAIDNKLIKAACGMVECSEEIREDFKIIEGNTHTYKEKEVYLRQNSLADEVAEFADDYMHMAVEFDLKQYSRLLPETKIRMQSLASKLAPALQHKRKMEAQGYNDSAITHGDDVNNLVSSEYSRVILMNAMDENNMIMDKRIPNILQQAVADCKSLYSSILSLVIYWLGAVRVFTQWKKEDYVTDQWDSVQYAYISNDGEDGSCNGSTSISRIDEKSLRKLYQYIDEVTSMAGNIVSKSDSNSTEGVLTSRESHAYSAIDQADSTIVRSLSDIRSNITTSCGDTGSSSTDPVQ